MAKNDKELKEVKVNLGGVLIDAQMDDEGNVIIPDEAKDVLASSLSVLKQAQGEIASEEDEDSNDSGEVKNAFTGLPMRELIGAPLFAAAEAQEKLASTALDFYKRIGYDEDGKKTRILEFTVERPVEGEPTNIVKQTVKAPFIGLVPIPSLLIDRIDVDFQMEVTDTNVNKSDSQASIETNASAKWFTVQASVSGKVSTSRETTRTTNQTAKYQVHVSASQQPQTEGLSKLMDIMASCIEPIKAES